MLSQSGVALINTKLLSKPGRRYPYSALQGIQGAVRDSSANQFQILKLGVSLNKILIFESLLGIMMKI